MTRAELLARHFARCFQEYRSRTPDVRARAERLAATASDPDGTAAARERALSALADLLFPSGVEDEAFSDRVMGKLRERGMNQRALAERLGVTEQTVSEMLSGKHRPQRQTVARVAAALAVHPEELWPT